VGNSLGDSSSSSRMVFEGRRGRRGVEGAESGRMDWAERYQSLEMVS